MSLISNIGSPDPDLIPPPSIAEQFREAYISVKALGERIGDDRPLEGVEQAIHDAAIDSDMSGFPDYVVYTFVDGSTLNDETLEIAVERP